MEGQMAASNKPAAGDKRIVIMADGPYLVQGDVPLVAKTQVVSEHGEPLTWKKERSLETEGHGEYALCRCGQSGEKPMCDGTHCTVDFDGRETADTRPTASRQVALPGATRIVVKKDSALCMESGFCGLSDAGMPDLAAGSADSRVRSLIIAMVERCPSGALTYRIEPDEPDIEPDLPQAVADTTEITSDGPIAGPLWVSGGIPIQRADGKPFETRNRVTLCNCGQSHNKPLCDGTHRHEAERLARKRKPAKS
jgi:CDGSH-type Zn-finger protein